MKVETSSSSAKYTTPTSVIITTRGGGNQLHGSLYETHRNNAFGVARARQDVLIGQNYNVPKLIRNEFGGSISGPVYLPRFGEGGQALYDGHNRTFFFFSREGVRLRQGVTREFVAPTGNWGEFGKFEVYGAKYKIMDCRATPATATNPADERCTPGVSNLNSHHLEKCCK